MAENKYYNLEKVIDEYLYAEDFEVKKRLLRNLDDDINHKERWSCYPVLCGK